jgi:hypothetical protein
VAVEWNVLIDQMKSVAARTAITTPNSIANLGTDGIGLAKCNAEPVRMAVISRAISFVWQLWP